MPTTYDLGAASPTVESARRRLEARLGASGQALPSGPVEGSEAERLRAARAAIEALQRARQAERAREPVVARARSPAVPPTAPRPVPEPPSGAPVEPPVEPRSEPAPPSTGPAPPVAVASRVRPREPEPTPTGSLGSLGHSAAARAALAGAAALALAALGFLAGRTAARPSVPVATIDVAPAPSPASGPASGPPSDAAPADAALVRDNLALQRELAALEDRVDALGGLLAPEAVAALAEADRELELIELGGADPGANPVDVERVRARVRGVLADALGPAALEALGDVRDER